MKRVIAGILLILAALPLAACGGSSTGEAGAKKPLATIQVSIATPANKAGAGDNGRQEKILTASQSFSVSVTASDIATPITGTANKSGTGVTTITLQVPVGTARAFTAKAFDAAGATGNQISYGSVTQSIVAGTNNIDMTLNVVPRTVVSPTSTTVNSGSASTLTFTVNDADSTAISNTPTTLVNWSVTGGAANGTISSSGVYTPPATWPGSATSGSQTVTVSATSAVDSSAPARTATLTLMNMATVNVKFTSTLFSDDFSSGNYSNWNLNASSGATFSVVSGELRQTNTSPGIQYHALLYPNGYSWTNYRLTVKARHISNYYSVTSMNIYFRVQQNPSSNTGPAAYCVQLQPGYSGIYKYGADGSSSLLASLSPAPTFPNYTGYNVVVEVVGSSIKAYIDGVLLASATDATFSSGSIGLATVHFVGGFDDVLVEPL